MTWYNKYRPTDFDDVIGQDLVKSVLKNSIAKNKIKHAYLFNGSKGIGKTTLARIFAAKICQTSENPEASIDIVEMDAASNTGIDDVRDLIESANNPPLVAPYKIYIIDEVHMLSKPAMNALLKILEEPPTHIVFLLATTNPEKLIPTVLSRLTKLNLSAHTIDGLMERLKYISSQEGVPVTDEGLLLLARRAGGSQRDSINLLETISSFELENYTENDVAQLIGALPTDTLRELSNDISTGKISPTLLTELQNTGLDGDTLLAQLLEFLLDESFGGRNKYDDIIFPLAEVIDLKLPLSTIISSLALLQVRITIKKKPTQPSVNQFDTSTVSVSPRAKPVENTSFVDMYVPDEDYIPEADVIIPTETLTTPVPTITAPKILPQPIPEVPIKPVSIGVVSPKDLDNFVQSLNFDTTTPPMFKMFIPALMVESIEENTATLKVGNPFALSQIKNVKNSQWLQKRLQDQFGTVFELNLIEGKVAPKISTTKEKSQSTPEAYSSTPNAQVTNTQPIPTHSNTPTPHKGEIFYTVYGDLPAQLDGKNVPLTTTITKPEVSHTEKWEQSIEDMFDLE
jgi:DNA polymerase III subunit gamma/tau